MTEILEYATFLAPIHSGIGSLVTIALSIGSPCSPTRKTVMVTQEPMLLRNGTKSLLVQYRIFFKRIATVDLLIPARYRTRIVTDVDLWTIYFIKQTVIKWSRYRARISSVLAIYVKLFKQKCVENCQCISLFNCHLATT